MGKHRSKQNEETSEDSTESCEGTATSSDMCTHVKNGHNIFKMKKALKKNEHKPICSVCQKNEENSNDIENKENVSAPSLWMCLNCGNINCGKDNKGHAKEHYDTPRSDSHYLAVDINNWKVWCYQCDSQINIDKEKQLKSQLENYKHSIRLMKSEALPKKIPSTCQKVMNNVEEKQKSKFPVVTGLYNLGNTCFFNAVLQCLARTPFLVKVLDDLRTMDIKFVLPGGKCKISNGQEEIDLPPIKGNIEKLGSNTITSVLCQTLIDMQNSHDPIRPSELLSAIRKKSIQCMDGGQHDSHELLRHLLELVRNEDLKRYQRIILEENDLKKCVPQNVDKDLKTKIKFYGHQASSRLLGPERVFRGILVSTLECSECHNSSSRTEPFLDLSLPVMIAKPHTPTLTKKEQNNSINDAAEITVNNVSNNVSSNSRKKQTRRYTSKKKNIKVFEQHLNNNDSFRFNNDSLPNENSISEEKPRNVVEFEEFTFADIEDNIETEGAIAPEVGESGYSSEKASAVASPVPLGELPPSNSNNQINGLQINDLLTYRPNTDWELVRIAMDEDNPPGNALNTPSPVDVSMAELNQVKVTSSFVQTESSVSLENDNENTLGLHLQNSLTINSDLTSPEGQTISPVSSPNTSKDSPTSPASSASLGEESDSPFIALYKEMQDFNRKNIKEDEFANVIKKEGEKSPSTQYRCDVENANDVNVNNESVSEVAPDSPKLHETNSLPPRPRYDTKEGECSVQSCLNQFTALELMSGNNKVGCEACTARENKDKEGKIVCTESTKQYLVMQVPPVLILHLKRFQMQRRGFSKVMKHIGFPMLLDLAPICKGHVNQRLYSLYGVVEHQGTYSGGHYVSYVKSRMPLEANDLRWSLVQKIETTETEESIAEQNSLLEERLAEAKSSSSTEIPAGQWYRISDARVVEVDEAAVLQSQAYLLFYERIL